MCSDSQVLGRATMDIRVCASLGRDRDVDEKKKNRLPSNASNEEPVALPKSGRKRGKILLIAINSAPKVNCGGGLMKAPSPLVNKSMLKSSWGCGMCWTN